MILIKVRSFWQALINFLLNRFPLARPVTLVLKQWLIAAASKRPLKLSNNVKEM